jgi:MFS family permease
VKRIQQLFASVWRLFKIPTDTKRQEIDERQRESLPLNFGAIVLNGLFFPTAGKILGSGLLLAWFLDEMGASTFVIGLLVPIQYGIALLAQPWIGQWMSGKARRVPYYRNQALLRGIVWSALAAMVWLADKDNRALLLVFFFLVVIVDAVAAGVGNIAFNETLAKTIPKALRGRARGGRGMCGAIVAGTAGVLIALFVSPESELEAFALLFAVAGLFYAAGGVTFAFIQEQPGKQTADSGHSLNLWRHIKEILSDRGYRRFLAVQALLVPATQGLVFFSVFGRREFHLDMKVLGLLLISDAVAPLAGNYVWGKLADRYSNRLVLGAAALVSVAAPLAALLLHFVGERFGPMLILTSFALIVFALGTASVGADLASKNLILELAPEQTRPVYIGVNDTLVALPTMLLAMGGAVIDWFGFLPVFIAVSVSALAAALLSPTLPKSRHVE